MADMDEAEDQGWGEGTFQLLFISMGQGDCCVVTCPDGAHIMIDCGSKAFEKDGMAVVEALIRGPWVLGREGTEADRLAALILTHCDQDHINKVKYTIGGSENALPIDEVYFSDTIVRTDFKSGPLRLYDAGGCSATLHDYAKVQAMYCVTLRTGTQTLHKWTPPFGAKQYATADDLIDNNRVTVRWDQIDDQTDWEVSIIAGNVLRQADDHSDTDGRNAASLVTLVRIGNEKILICGDATRSTQNYLYNTFKNTNDIKNLALLQLPHHGSTATSSTADFVNLVKPQRVIISAKSDEHTHHHPGRAVIDAYIPHANKTDAARPSRAWEQLDDDAFHKIREAWIADKKKGTITYDETLNRITGIGRYIRTGITDDTDGEILLDGIGSPGTKYVLYQRPLAREIRQTGLDENQWYYFP